MIVFPLHHPHLPLPSRFCLEVIVIAKPNTLAVQERGKDNLKIRASLLKPFSAHYPHLSYLSRGHSRCHALCSWWHSQWLANSQCCS